MCRSCQGKRERAPKTCPQCSQPVKAAATLGAWCLDCAYPNCVGCGKEKRPQNGKYHAKRVPQWTCQKCLTKKCLQCDAIPGQYQGWCVTCAFPPCSGGCGQPRPYKKLKYHAQNIPKWYCDSCRDGYPPCPNCGAARPDNRAYHVKNMPEWTCAKCLPKACSQCGRAMHGKVAADTWCSACAFPPCPRCEAARPNHPQYHAKVTPVWACSSCAAKPCANCGRPMDSRAQPDARCQTCAYPPCDKCNHPRPQEKGYHAKVTPHWTCADCTIKCCSTCGKPLGARARADALCLACAFPPCSAGCGANRPSQSRTYHVRNIPTWVRQNCQTANAAAPPHDQQLRGAPKKRRMNPK